MKSRVVYNKVNPRKENTLSNERVCIETGGSVQLMNVQTI